VFVSTKNESFLLVIRTHQMQLKLHKSAPTTQKFRLGGKKKTPQQNKQIGTNPNKFTPTTQKSDHGRLALLVGGEGCRA